jgi:PAS domain S-box-containing protein
VQPLSSHPCRSLPVGFWLWATLLNEPLLMKREPHRVSSTPTEELFEHFPRGLAVLELSDANDVSTWRLASINPVASSLVAPSIETFLSSTRLRLGTFVDLPALYLEILSKQRARILGIVETRGSGSYNERLYMVSAFPASARCVGILFEDAHSMIAARSARALTERQLAQTCEFVGAILWRAEPETLRFTYVSAQAQAILGYWLERWIGETNFWKKHLFPDDRERVASVCEKIFSEHRRRDFEFRMISMHGQIVWFHAAAEVSEEHGRPPQLVGVMNDITDLKRAEERIRSLTSRLMRLQDDERRHISRELHDSLGQYLTSIKINLELVKREGATLEERHRALLAESSETLERCVQEVRSVSYLLHPPLLDELGLLAALRWFTAGFAERSGIEVNLNTPQAFSRLPQEMELALFRIVQESLTNAQRHSGSASVWVTLSEHKDRAEVRITDSGAGVPSDIVEQIKQGKAIDGVGLRGMYERVRELGGQLEIESSGMGTAITAVLPLQFAGVKRTRATEERETEEREAEEEGRKSRFAGRPLETTDFHIDSAASGTNGAGETRGVQERALKAARTRHRRASRRST